MKVDVQRLHERCKELTDLWELDYPVGDPLIEFDDQRLCVVEHTCHELAHATLLDLTFGEKLAKRVSAKIKRLSEEDGDFGLAELNETETFCVVIGVFETLGLEMDRWQMLDANSVQVSDDRTEIEEHWRRFETRKRYRDTVKRIAEFFLALQEAP